MRRSFRTHGFHAIGPRGFTPGWYAHAPLGRLFVPTGHRIPAQGAALGIRRHPSPRSEGTPHIVGCSPNVRAPQYGAPSERGILWANVPKALPWAGMHGSVGASRQRHFRISAQPEHDESASTGSFARGRWQRLIRRRFRHLRHPSGNFHSSWRARSGVMAT